MTIVAILHSEYDGFFVRVAAERLNDFLRVWKVLDRA